MQTSFRSFGSDNHAGVHPEILRALEQANRDHCVAYGADPWTDKARAVFRAQFGDASEVAFVFNGTAANVLGLRAIAQPYHAVICAETAHIHNDECGAPEGIAGIKLLTIPTPDGKLTPELVAPRLTGFGNMHHVQPRVISLTQSTELGTVYRVEEIRALADLAHRHGMFLHMDGARLANAAAFLEKPFRAFTTDAGVDVLSFGGTKNGLLGGEAVVFLRPGLGGEFPYIRKQGMQLASKMRFVAAQFLALFENDLCLRNARHANARARELAKKLEGLPGVRVTQPVEANGLFVQLPESAIAPLQADFHFYVWEEARHVVRWMCAFDTTGEDIDALVAAVRAQVS